MLSAAHERCLDFDLYDHSVLARLFVVGAAVYRLGNVLDRHRSHHRGRRCFCSDFDEHLAAFQEPVGISEFFARIAEDYGHVDDELRRDGLCGSNRNFFDLQRGVGVLDVASPAAGTVAGLFKVPPRKLSGH